MAKRLDSLTLLTEFAPLSPEAESRTSLLKNFFKKNKENPLPKKSYAATGDDISVNAQSISQQSSATSAFDSCENFMSDDVNVLDVPSSNIRELESQNMAGVLKLVKNIVERKKMGLQNYKESDFKQYWMPDSNCKECYECGDKFTTFRRRHHCRVCGQIFCWRCCNQGISGNLIGYSGDLRVCTYCHKMVSTCMQSFDAESDLPEEWQPFHDNARCSVSSQHQPEWSTSQQNVSTRRKSSVMGFREEEIAKAKPAKSTRDDFCCDMTYSNNISADTDSANMDCAYLSTLFNDYLTSENRLLSSDEQYSDDASFIHGCDIVQWLIKNNAVSSSCDALRLAQSFIDSHFIEPVTPTQFPVFSSDAFYKLKGVYPKLQHMDSVSESQESMDPLWVKEIQTSDSCIDRESNVSLDSIGSASEKADTQITDSRSRIPSSSSSFYLDLDIKESTVRVSRPLLQAEQTYLTSPTSCDFNSKDKKNEYDDHVCSPYGVQDMFAEDFLKAYGANLLGKNGSRSSQDSHTMQQLKDENEKKIVSDELNSSYAALENNLLRQLLESNMLSSTWCETILPIVHSVIDKVHPDVKNDVDSMDIRQYVQFKKVPGGTKTECGIVHGVVFTKSVAHRKMEQNISKPAILLLSSPIAYQRTENKLSSLDPLIMQEFEYLKNTIGKLTVCKPDVLLVEKSVSRVAQEMLLSFGITVALNVKQTVMDRVARCTKAAVVSTVDAHLGKPQLGSCKEFKVKTYAISSGKTKTLMFLDGCPADLGCTILLRGGCANELKKVKQIVQFMLYVAYNWKLERSFLVDEFALPPPKTALGVLDSPKNETDSNYSTLCEPSEKKGEKYSASDVNTKMKTKSDETNHRLATKCIDDFSDPLQSYLQSESENIIFPDSFDLQVDNLPVANTFSKLLDDIILCCSLYVDVNLPYLETETGKQCPLRKFFSPEIYWSAHFQKTKGSPVLHSTEINFEDDGEPYEIQVYSANAEIQAHHPFITHRFTDKFCKTPDIYALLADYRARGCTIKYLCPHQQFLKGKEKRSSSSGHFCKEKQEVKEKDIEGGGTSLLWEKKIDALDPFNHQKLEVLFCSYSCTSNNAPNYCVSPWVVKMDFYGTNDIPFGGFLEKYCFRSSYVCPSPSCDTPMTGHVRKFVHDSGCVRIVLLEYSSGVQSADTDILMWSWCPKCKQASSVVPMSDETWAFSFAKYLELRFYASSYQRQATNDMCNHSLHHCHNQYFAHKQIVAIFEYNPIIVWEIVLPSITIPIHDEATSASTVVDQIKNIAVKGSEIYSIVLERLFAFKQQYAGNSCEDAITNMISLQKTEMSAFREKIEQIQLRLTSPTLENMQVQVSMLESAEKNLNKGICHFMWRVEDQVTLLKYHIAEAVQLWNSRIQEFLNARKKEEKQASKPLLSTRTSENEDLANGDYKNQGSSSDLPSVESNNVLHKTVRAKNSTKDFRIFHLNSAIEFQPSSAGTSLSWHIFLKKQKPRNCSWMERSMSCESIPESLRGMKIVPRLFRAFSAPTSLSYEFGDACENAEEQQAEDEKNSISSSDSSYTYGVAPGIYAGLMVPEPEDNESYVVCHKEHSDVKYSSAQSLRGHERSKSEGHQMDNESFSRIIQEREESVKREKKELTVKNILSQFLSSSEIMPIQSPFPPTQHIMGCKNEKELIPVMVYDDEPSSIIAYALASPEYEHKLQELRVNVTTVLNSAQRDSQTSSPMPKRKQNSKPSSEKIPGSSETVFSQKTENSADFLDLVPCNTQEAEKSASKLTAKMPNFHLEVQFSDSSAKFYCRVYYAEQFRKLRCLIFNEGEERYIRSLSHCVPWMARGGKSGSTFCKTKDDRFILKQMQKLELQSFLDLAPSYFQYINKACIEQNPTLLAKIIGVYRIGYKNSITNTASKMDLLVMENLFYGCNIARKYDLKGSVRNRLVNTTGVQEEDIVLLDENLLKITCDNPLYIRPHSKAVLSRAIENDTQFLADQSVMDYSLLVGMDEEKKSLIVGIIDYIRTFTWDKKVEMLVKSSGILGGHGKMPTVVSPELYQMRFREAMDGYFLWVPDRWTNLGKDMPA